MGAEIDRNALFDELAKIAAERADTQEGKKGRPLRAMLTAAAGGAAGYGASELLHRKWDFLQRPGPGVSPETLSKRIKTTKIILPILMGTSAMLADRYRQKLNDEYSKVRGFGDRPKSR